MKEQSVEKKLYVKNFTLSNISESESHRDGSKLSKLEEDLKQVEKEIMRDTTKKLSLKSTTREKSGEKKGLSDTGLKSKTPNSSKKESLEFKGKIHEQNFDIGEHERLTSINLNVTQGLINSCLEGFGNDEPQLDGFNFYNNNEDKISDIERVSNLEHPEVIRNLEVSKSVSNLQSGRYPNYARETISSSKGNDSKSIGANSRAKIQT